MRAAGGLVVRPRQSDRGRDPGRRGIRLDRDRRRTRAQRHHDALPQLQAMRGGTAEPVFRVPWNDMVIIKRALDVGARSLLFPLCRTQKKRERRSPPHAIRRWAFAVSRRCLAPTTTVACRTTTAMHISTPACWCSLKPRPRSRRSKPSRRSKALMASSSVPATWPRTSVILATPSTPMCRRPSKMPLSAFGRQANPRVLCHRQCRRRRALFAMGYNFTAVGSDVGLLARTAESVAARFRVS